MGYPKAKDVLILASEIVEAEKKLAALKQKWEALFGGEARTAGERKDGAGVIADGFPARVLLWINSNPGVHTIAAVAKGIGGDELHTGKVLYRLSRNGKLRSPSRGKYEQNDADTSLTDDDEQERYENEAAEVSER